LARIASSAISFLAMVSSTSIVFICGSVLFLQEYTVAEKITIAVSSFCFSRLLIPFLQNI